MTVAPARAGSLVGVFICVFVVGKTIRTRRPTQERQAGRAAGGRAGRDGTLGTAHGRALHVGGGWEGVQAAPTLGQADRTGAAAGASADAPEIAGGWLAMWDTSPNVRTDRSWGEHGTGHGEKSTTDPRTVKRVLGF